MARLAFMETLEQVNQTVLGVHLARRGLTATAPGRWERGDRLGAVTGLSPVRWPVVLTVEGRDVTMRVRAGGQLLTRTEAAFWEAEWQGVLRAAAGEPTNVHTIHRHADAALVENGLLVGAAVVSALVFGAAGAVLGGPLHGVLAGGLAGLVWALLGCVWGIQRDPSGR